MPQAQYRLRLTEGTLLVVDHDALTSWLTDDRALVQPMGSHRWRLLRQFLADERSGIGSNYWEAPPAADDGRGRALPRPRVSKGESVLGQDSGWVDPGKALGTRPVSRIPSAPEKPSPPPDDDSDEIFAPDLSEADAAPWDWALDHNAPPPRPGPGADDFEFPNDEHLTLEDLVAPNESDRAPVLSEKAVAVQATTSDLLSEVLDETPEARIAPTMTADADSLLAGLLEPPAMARPRVQVLADDLAASPAVIRDEGQALSLKALDAGPAPALDPEEAPLELHEWDPGLVDRFCGTVADWSGTIGEWLDKGQKVAAHRREYKASVTQALQQAGPSLRARLREVPDASRSLLQAWRELVSGWIADLQVWWSARRDQSRLR
jgi:hypothetical protein